MGRQPNIRLRATERPVEDLDRAPEPTLEPDSSR